MEGERMGRSQRSKRGRYLRTQRREMLADENEEKDKGKREVMARILAEPSPAERTSSLVSRERRRHRLALLEQWWFSRTFVEHRPHSRRGRPPPDSDRV